MSIAVLRGDARALPLPDASPRRTSWSVEYFWARVDKRGDCWIWTRAINGNGYGSLRFRSVSTFAHRVAYELEVGPIPGGQSLTIAAMTLAPARCRRRNARIGGAAIRHTWSP